MNGIIRYALWCVTLCVMRCVMLSVYMNCFFVCFLNRPTAGVAIMSVMVIHICHLVGMAMGMKITTFMTIC